VAALAEAPTKRKGEKAGGRLPSSGEQASTQQHILSSMLTVFAGRQAPGKKAVRRPLDQGRQIFYLRALDCFGKNKSKNAQVSLDRNAKFLLLYNSQHWRGYG